MGYTPGTTILSHVTVKNSIFDIEKKKKLLWTYWYSKEPLKTAV